MGWITTKAVKEENGIGLARRQKERIKTSFRLGRALRKKEWMKAMELDPSFLALKLIWAPTTFPSKIGKATLGVGNDLSNSNKWVKFEL